MADTTIKDVMSPQVELVDPKMVLADAARRMRDQDIGALPIGEDDRLVGMITDRDIAVRAVALSKDTTTETVGETMTPGIEYCYDDQPVGEVSEMMSEKKLRRLPVLNRDKRLVGIVSLGDIATKGSKIEAGDALHGISAHA